MSPASQGALEVERYIGSCLISSTVRPSMHKDFVGKKLAYSGKGYAAEQCSQGQYATGTWAGTPLISMTSTPRRNNQQRSSPSPLAQQQTQQQQQSVQQIKQSHPQQQHPQQQQCNGSVDQQLPSAHLHNKNPLVRLAIHTQGAPLILTGRFHNRGKSHNTAVNSSGTCSTSANGNATATTMSTKCSGARSNGEQAQRKMQTNTGQNNSKDNSASNVTNIDSLSIASDESSNNSENSLPRIIKPRKRRKKDRKPPNAIITGDLNKQQQQQHQQQQSQQQQQQQQSSQEEVSANVMASNIVCGNSNVDQVTPPAKLVTQACYESTAGHYRNQQRRLPTMPKESVYGRLHSDCSSSLSSQEVVDTRQQRYAYRHVQVKVLDDNRNVIVPLPVRQLKGFRSNGVANNVNVSPNGTLNVNNCNAISQHRYHENSVSSDGPIECYGGCQCRYCDPAALIWDVDRNGYPSQYLSPYPPSRQLPPVFLSPYSCHEQYFDDNHPGVCLHRDASVAVLRRSWSDPVTYFSDEIVAPSRDVGVIGDRGQSELRSRTGGAWRPDVSSPASDANSTSSSLTTGSSIIGSQGLEVSTEIVTSPNGHRDLEIKFYSSSPSSTAPEEDKVGFGFAEDDGEEEFSDIWSYHESKLQQDFRTLLQAEE